MRRNPNGLRPARLGPGLLAMLLLLSSRADAQTAKTKSAPPPVPLGSYVPGEKTVLYLEMTGLDAHGDAWRKTAAYKMLTETKLGAMLEDLSAQFLEKILSRNPDRRVTGTEVVTFLEHMARSGFVYATTNRTPGSKDPAGVLVVRGANGKSIRSITGRLVLTLGGPQAKPELSKRPSGRSIVLMKGSQPGQRWAWWAEKDDLVVVPDVDSADGVAEVIGGKRPNAVDHPIRAELARTEEGLEPILMGFLDAAIASTKGAEPTIAKLQLRGVQRVDFRWGASGDALESVVRIRAKTPHQGLLTLFDQPVFDTKSLPPMMEGVTGFTAISVAPAQAFDLLASIAKGVDPGLGGMVDQAVESFRSRSRLQLRKDVLAHLGPKMVLYTLPPAAPSAAAKAAAEKAATAPEDPLRANPYLRMLGTNQIPRGVLMMDIDDRAAFERSLDALMIVVNQEMRARITAPAAPDEERGEGGAGPSRRRGESTAPEFKMTPGQIKSYVLNVPSELAKLPAGFRPTIRVGSKQVVFATSPELARQALEVTKATAWSPADQSAAALEKVSGDLVVLSLDDPRERMPKLLAGLPALMQQAIDAALAGTRKPSDTAAGPAPADAAAPASAPADAPAVAPAPGTPGTPGSEGTPKPDDSFQVHIDPAKLPSADALKALLFPGTFSVSRTAEEVRFVRRVAFPNLVAPMSGLAMAVVRPMIVKAREAAGVKPPGQKPAEAAAKGAAAPAAKKDSR